MPRSPNPHREQILKRIRQGELYQSIADAYQLSRAQISQYAKGIGHARRDRPGETSLHRYTYHPTPRRRITLATSATPKEAEAAPVSEAPMLDQVPKQARKLGDYTIEPDVPIPGGDGCRRCKYPFEDMNVGESFGFAHSVLESVRRAASAYKRRHDGVRFVFRQMDDRTWRCWKLENE